MVAKNLKTNCGASAVCRYVGIPYWMTQLSRNTGALLADVTALTGKALDSFVYWSVETLTCRLAGVSLIMDSECQLP